MNKINLKFIGVVKELNTLTDNILKEVTPLLREEHTSICEEFASVTTGKHTSSKYTKEDQTIIDRFIEELGITKVKTTREGYTVTITPLKPSKDIAKNIISELSSSDINDIRIVASKISKATK